MAESTLINFISFIEIKEYLTNIKFLKSEKICNNFNRDHNFNELCK